MGIGIVGLYQIIGALADDASAEVVAGDGVIAVNPATDGGVGARDARHLDRTAAANRVVAVHCWHIGYRIDGGSDRTGIRTFATCFTIVGSTGKGRGSF